MPDLFKIPSWLRRLLNSPKSELNRWQRAVRFALELGRHCASELRHDKATQMAAALTYHTLFSLLPMIVLALVAVNAFIGPEDREAFKQGAVNWVVNVLQEGDPAIVPVIGPPALEVDLEDDEEGTTDEAEETSADDGSALPGDLAPPEGSRLDDLTDEIAEARAETDTQADGDANPPAETDAMAERHEEFLRVRERLDEELTNILDTLEGVDIRSIGVVGVLLFIYGATALLVTIEDSFNAVFGTTEGRPWYVRLPLYYTMITLGPVVLVGAQVLQNQLLGTLEVYDWTNWVVGPLAFLAPILASWMVLFLLYLLMPNASVSKQAAAVGGFVAAVLWVITKDIFQFYVSHGVMGSLYGALALVPLFLLWLWTAWLIVLFGLELTYTLQAMRGRYLKHQIHKQPEDDAVVDAAVMVPLATRLAAAFERGETVSLTDLGQAANLPPRIVRKMMEMLESAHIVLRVQDTVGQSYSLARPADKIRVDEVLAAAEELLPSHEAMTSTEDAKLAWHFVDKLHDATHRIAQQRTLASLTREERPTPP